MYIINKTTGEVKETINVNIADIPKSKFTVDDDVYVVDFSKLDTLTCQKCNGTGYVTTTSEEFGEVSIVCPDCQNENFDNGENKNLRDMKYAIHSPKKCKIKEAIINISKDETKFTYRVTRYKGTFDESRIFVTLEEAKEYATEVNKQHKAFALASLNKEDICYI